MDQKELWTQVIAIRRRVLEAIGTEISSDLRYSRLYETYTNLCNDAQLAYSDGLLTPNIVTLLEEFANKVIAFQSPVAA